MLCFIVQMVNKIIIDYSVYKKFIKVKKDKNNNLIVQGFFGETLLKKPKKTIIKIKNECIIIFFKKNNNFKYLKSFYNLIIFSFIGSLFGFFTNLIIKGIGFKFESSKSPK